MVFSWSPIWGSVDEGVLLNKFPILVIPKRLLATMLDPVLELVVEQSLTQSLAT